jgi:predicted dehydrogenase
MLRKGSARLGIRPVFHLLIHNTAGKLFPGAIPHKDLDIFCRQHFDLLVIALHPEHRLELYRKFGDRLQKSQIFLEKPLTSSSLSAAQNSRLLEFENNYGKNTLVHYPENLDPLFGIIRDLVSGKIAGIPKLTIHEIQTVRCKNREKPGNQDNSRHTEPLAIQESVHDLAFALELLHYAGQPDGLKIVSAIATPLRHPSSKRIPYAGSSYSLYQARRSGALVSIINSFIDPYVRKEKVLVCRDARGRGYSLIANFKPSLRRYCRAYDADGRLVFDAAVRKETRAVMRASSKELKMSGQTGPAWNIDLCERLLKAAHQKRFLSNFPLAAAAEQNGRKALRLQKKNS